MTPFQQPSNKNHTVDDKLDFNTEYLSHNFLFAKQ